jgi:hypothetical protein
MPFFRAGMVLLSEGKSEASHAENMHQNETKANCTIDNVIGLEKAFRIDLDEVFVRAEVRYQTANSIWKIYN